MRLVVCVTTVLLAAASALAAADEWPITPGAPTAEEILNAPVLEEETIAVPTGASTIQGPFPILNAAQDGYVFLMLSFNYGILFEDSQAIAVDPKTGRATFFRIPKGLNVSAALENGAADAAGRHYCFFSGDSVGQLWRYDATDNTFVSLGKPPFDRGGGYNRLVARQGRIWGTVNSGGEVGVYAYDPVAGRFESYGFLAVRQQQGGETHGYSMTVVGGYAYVAVGKVPWRLVALELKIRRSEVILEAPAGNSQIWLHQTCAIRRPDPKDPNRMECYALESGKARLADGAWGFGKPVPGQAPRTVTAPLPPRPEFNTDELAPDGEGNCVLRYRNQGETDWRRVEMRVKVYPQSIRRLTALPDGRLFGTIGSYEGCFLYDPAQGRSRLTARCKLSHFATVSHEGRLYLSGYPGAPVFVFDPAATGARPLPAPELAGELRTASGAHKMWDGAVGRDGSIYFTGEMGRDGDGGALAWWDPKTKTAGGLPWQTFAGQKTLYAAAALQGSRIVLNAHVTVDNLTGKTPETAKLFVLDVDRREITDAAEPVAGAKMLGPLVEAMPGRILSVGCLGRYTAPEAQCLLFGYDLNEKKTIFRKALPVPLAAWSHGMRGGQDFVLGPDGHVWTFLGQQRSPEKPTLVRIDPRTAAIKIVGRVGGRSPLAFVGRDLYRGCEHKAGEKQLRRLKGVVPQPSS